MSAPEVRCECCAAGPHAAPVWELIARHGHAIQVVSDPGAPKAFLYTVGADPEFLVEDVPVSAIDEITRMLNFLVERVRTGHPVLGGHTVAALGIVFEATQLEGAELRQALASKCLACNASYAIAARENRTARVVLLEPISLEWELRDRAGNAGAAGSRG